MQRAIPTALLTAIRNLGLYYYSSPPSCDVASSWLGIVAELDSDADIVDRTRGGPNSKRGRKALEPLLLVREQGARTSEPRENCIMSGSPLCRGLTRATYILCIEHRRASAVQKRRSAARRVKCVAVGNWTRDLLDCRRTLYAKSHSNGVIDCYSEPRLVLLQYPASTSDRENTAMYGVLCG